MAKTSISFPVKRGRNMKSFAIPLEIQFIWGSAFRHIGSRDLPFVPGGRDVEIAVTAAVLAHIRFPVGTWADDIPILFPVAGCEPAGTAHIPVSFTVGEESVQDIGYLRPVSAEKVSFRLLDPLQRGVKLIDRRHIPSASRRASSLNPTMTFPPMRIVGKLQAGLYFLTSSIVSLRSSPLRRSTSLHS